MTRSVDLEYAWNTMNIYELENCFRVDFMHNLQSEDWYDYDGDGSIDQYWGLEIELDFAETAFTEAYSISFSLSGGESSPWSGDSTGQSRTLMESAQLGLIIGSISISTMQTLF